MSRLLVALWCMAWVALGMGCGRDSGKNVSGPDETGVVLGATGVIRLQVSFAEWGVVRAKPAAIQAIDKVTAYVLSSTGAEVTRADLTLADNMASGRIVVPAQDNLRVVLVYLDGEIVRYLGEAVDVDVPAGEEVTTEIIVHFMGVSVQAPEVLPAGDAFTMSWTTAPLATGYQLVEATRSDFVGATPVYDGSETSVTLSARNEGTFYYRARAHTPYGLGPWYSRGWAAVTFSVGTDGVIVIETEIPADEPTRLEPGPSTAGVLWHEDWEGDWAANWAVDGGTWEVGVPTSGPNEARHGEKVAATVLDGDYVEHVSSRLFRFKRFVVPKASQNPRLRFWHWYNISTADFGIVQIKVGTEEWEDLTATQFKGSSSGVWSNAFYDLSAYADSTVQIGFRFFSTTHTVSGSARTAVGPGWYIDEVWVEYDP